MPGRRVGVWAVPRGGPLGYASRAATWREVAPLSRGLLPLTRKQGGLVHAAAWVVCRPPAQWCRSPGSPKGWRCRPARAEAPAPSALSVTLPSASAGAPPLHMRCAGWQRGSLQCGRMPAETPACRQASQGAGRRGSGSGWHAEGATPVWTARALNGSSLRRTLNTFSAWSGAT